MLTVVDYHKKWELDRSKRMNSIGICLRDFSVIPLLARKHLPKKEGVYMLTDKDHNALYIGQAASLYDRLIFHEKINGGYRKVTEKDTAFIYYLITESIFCRDTIEKNLIVTTHPRYNIHHNTKRY